VTLRGSSGRTTASPSSLIDLKDTVEYEKNEFLVMIARQELNEGQYVMAIGDVLPNIIAYDYKIFTDFHGNLTAGIVGFYRSVYTDPKSGKRIPIATSKFQPTYARRQWKVYLHF